MIGMVPLRALLTASHRHFLDHDPESRNQHVRRAGRFSAVGLVYGLVFAAALFVCAPLVTVLLGDDYDGTVTMLRVLSPLVAVRACAEFPLNGLLGLGKLGVRTATIAGAAVSALALYLLLIPALGWQGAVIGTYASEVLLGIVAWRRRREAERGTPGHHRRPPVDRTAPPPWPHALALHEGVR
jgi:O-antigen/teichoic acid export membrane protein